MTGVQTCALPILPRLGAADGLCHRPARFTPAASRDDDCRHRGGAGEPRRRFAVRLSQPAHSAGGMNDTAVARVPERGKVAWQKGNRW